MELLEKQEKMLHKHEVRIDKKQVSQLLDENFVEIWYSGKTYYFKDTIENLSQEKIPEFIFHSQEYEYIKLEENIVQVLYKSFEIYKDWEKKRFAKRMSIWKQKENNLWKMVYHQATPVEEFEMI